ncbi:MAG: tetratricopeptide repeat protein [Cyclobacteriaceae bacterium]|nr:tetratricopeptide repeat protein [Cyclobacteriaceae bacterium]
MDKHQKALEEFDEFIAGLPRSFTDEASQKGNLSNKVMDFEEYKILADGIKYSGRNELLKKMQDWDEQCAELPRYKGKTEMLNPRWLAVAATVAFFIVAGISIYSYLDSGYDNLVTSYYQPYNYIPETTRSAGAEENSIEHIFTHYDRGEYVQTIQLINGLPGERKNELTDYILANAYQAVGKYDSAIGIFDKIIADQSVYAAGARWYLALCYLSIEQKQKALPLLEELKASNSSYAQKAGALWEDLK